MRRFILPFVIFLALVVFLAVGLRLDPREVPSPLIGKPAPAFNLPRLDDPSVMVTTKEMLGKVWLFNVWASWCGACREEHQVLVDLSIKGSIPIYGMNYKDTRFEAMQWLLEGGNPYIFSVMDADGRVGIDYGVYGVPETYVIDKRGMIAYKQIGAVTKQILDQKILPLIKELQSQ